MINEDDNLGENVMVVISVFFFFIVFNNDFFCLINVFLRI